MRLRASAIAALLIIGSSFPASAAPISGLNVDIGLDARVSGVSGLFIINEQRQYPLSTVSQLPWNVSDELSIRWRVTPDQTFDCSTGATQFRFGGITAGPSSSSCGGALATSAVLERADGTTLPAGGLFETALFGTPLGFGPTVDLATGAVAVGYSQEEGIAVSDCCLYVVDPESGAIVTFPGWGSYPDLSAAVIAATFRETSGEGLYTASTFINDGSGDALTLRLDVLFDVSWQVEVGQVPRAVGNRDLRARHVGASPVPSAQEERPPVVR